MKKLLFLMLLSFNTQATDVFTFEFNNYEAWVDHNKNVICEESRYGNNVIDLRRHDLVYWHLKNHEDHKDYKINISKSNNECYF